mmetsp:Transcript_64508/g.154054  ORF Transcript_64508/g.154054 Transcript_64508/m.154054 type:complete len:194 (-) Transcript_64508:179-760(-)|eukprot:CAMPEP_0178381806 /NCGR_PEP_ID=MMETSP0689_2-20121128/6175_1 /TAXON_ID=160604 /ORGANISM="Amphidinium massartii, Strain CS-259" /LENGTH=193 /DNA_ID=CAMNT_0020002005 /DNA_START=187 /DNA_END=768 /DNA_ORIENTATION=+
MRVSWTPERAREEVSSGFLTGAEPRFGSTSRKKLERASLPVRATEPPPEVRALREQVARLQAVSQREAQERHKLERKVDILQAELRKTLDQNRELQDALDERKRVVADATASEEARHRELALDSARELFRNMLQGATWNDGLRSPLDDGDMEACMSSTGSGRSSHSQQDCGRTSCGHSGKRRFPSQKIQAGGA